jgi:hypothetical protein
MLSERDIELSHPEAFDFIFGNLPASRRANFNRHLSDCLYCQGVINEYSEIGGIIQGLPPHAEPPADLEDRTVAAMIAALAEQRANVGQGSPDAEAATRISRVPGRLQPAEPETRVMPRPQFQPQAKDATRPPPSPASQPTAETPSRPVVTPLPVWRRHPRRLPAIAAAAAAILIAAIIIPFSLGGGRATLAQAAVRIPLRATAAAEVFGVSGATAQATARQADQSWTFELSVRGLKPLPSNEFYECWWAARGSSKLHPVLATGGSFVVGPSGSTTVTMTTGVDPHQFPTMEITVERTGNGTSSETVLLSGQAL